jgi:hypothetical protein
MVIRQAPSRAPTVSTLEAGLGNLILMGRNSHKLPSNTLIVLHLLACKPSVAYGRRSIRWVHLGEGSRETDPARRYTESPDTLAPRPDIQRLGCVGSGIGYPELCRLNRTLAVAAHQAASVRLHFGRLRARLTNLPVRSGRSLVSGFSA